MTAVVITGKTIHGWRFGGSSGEMRFFANQDLITSTGEIIKAGSPKGKNKWYSKAILTISDDDVTIPAITDLPTTTDAIPSDATFGAYFFDQQLTERGLWIGDFKIPHTAGSPIDWPSIFIANNPPSPQPRPPGINYDEAVLLIRQSLGDLRLANINFHGEVETDVAPADSDRPIVPGINSPLLQGFIKSSTATLVAGTPKTVLEPLVAADSPLMAVPVDNGIIGRLRISNRVPGVSFDVDSEEGSDSGVFKWFLFD